MIYNHPIGNIFFVFFLPIGWLYITYLPPIFGKQKSRKVHWIKHHVPSFLWPVVPLRWLPTCQGSLALRKSLLKMLHPTSPRSDQPGKARGTCGESPGNRATGWWVRNPVNSPVDMIIIPLFYRVSTIPGGDRRIFWTINSMIHSMIYKLPVRELSRSSLGNYMDIWK